MEDHAAQAAISLSMYECHKISSDVINQLVRLYLLSRSCVCTYISSSHRELVRSFLLPRRLCVCIIRHISLQSPHCPSVSVSAVLDTRHSIVKDILFIPHKPLSPHLPVSHSTTDTPPASAYYAALLRPLPQERREKKLVMGSQVILFPFPFPFP